VAKDFLETGRRKTTTEFVKTSSTRIYVSHATSHLKSIFGFASGFLSIQLWSSKWQNTTSDFTKTFHSWKGNQDKWSPAALGY